MPLAIVMERSSTCASPDSPTKVLSGLLMYLSGSPTCTGKRSLRHWTVGRLGDPASPRERVALGAHNLHAVALQSGP